MSTDYNYDEQGQFFPYFVVTVAAIFTIPITYSALKPSKELENTGSRISSDYHPEHEDLIDQSRRKQKRRERKLKRMLLSVLGWSVMAYMVYLMVTVQRTTPKIWDPYEILGISRSSGEDQIRKHYKRLSIKEHPDKRQPDPSKNETTQSINDHWVEIVKAFKTLTDEEIRNNYIQYGHPDGKQSFSIGIALPQFLVSEGNGKYVLMLYAAFLGVVLPYFVGKWWYGTQKRTREGILVSSAGKLFFEYGEQMDESGVVRALSSGNEYEERLPAKVDTNGSSKLESKVLENVQVSPLLSKNEQDTITTLTDEKRRKICSLLWAYLNRVELNDPVLESQKFEAAPIAFSLNEAFHSMTLAWGNIKPLLSSFRVSQCLIQAVPPTPASSPLLQLPHFTSALCSHITQSTGNPNLTTTLHPFLGLPDAQRRAIIVGKAAPLLSESQYNTAMRVAAQIPAPRIEVARFKVMGERVLAPSSLLQFVLKVRFVPPTIPQSDIPAPNPEDLEDPDPKEGDLAALRGKRKKQITDKKTGKTKTVYVEEEKIQPPLVHAPYYARDHAPRFRVLLEDSRQAKVAVPPFTFATFDKPIFETDEKGELTTKPTYAVQTLRMQFQAPPQVGDYNFRAWTVCDSWLGCDAVTQTVMQIQEPKAEDAIEEEEDMSEPEEDSLAGQMAAMKGQKVKKSRVRADSIDDESSSDEDADSDSDTDTDTDTDEE